MNNIFDRMSEPGKPPVPADEQTGNLQPAPNETRNKTRNKTGNEAKTETAGDSFATEKAVKDAAQELLRAGTIDETVKPALFRLAITHEHRVNQVLEPFDLVLKLDTHRGVAWLAVHQHGEQADSDEAWAHPLVRRQRLTLEQSLLVALLRQAFAMHEQKHGVGQSVARIAVDELLPQYLTYFKDTGSDTKNESRLLSLLDQLKTYAIVSEVDKNQEIVVRPMIAHLANPESLTALLKTLQAQANGANHSE